MQRPCVCASVNCGHYILTKPSVPPMKSSASSLCSWGAPRARSQTLFWVWQDVTETRTNHDWNVGTTTWVRRKNHDLVGLKNTTIAQHLPKQTSITHKTSVHTFLLLLSSYFINFLSLRDSSYTRHYPGTLHRQVNVHQQCHKANEIHTQVHGPQGIYVQETSEAYRWRSWWILQRPQEVDIKLIIFLHPSI